MAVSCPRELRVGNVRLQLHHGNGSQGLVLGNNVLPDNLGLWERCIGSANNGVFTAEGVPPPAPGWTPPLSPEARKPVPHLLLARDLYFKYFGTVLSC